MTRSERLQVESDYRQAVNPRRLLTRCAVGLLVIAAIAGSGIFAGSLEDPLHGALSARPASLGR